MCFSAQASFSAAVVLSILGTISVRQAPTKRFLPLALIPSFFALQQFSEGILWITLGEQASLGWMSKAAPAIFMFFALLVWPVWIPFSLWIVEKNPKRKRVIAILGVIGALVGIYYAFALPFSDYRIAIVKHSIQYDSNVLNWKWPYTLAIVGSIFISSVRGIWIFGLLQVVAFSIAYYAYVYAFASVWCFFAAWTSIIIIGVLTYIAPNENGTQSAS